ncbi:MAG: hypothetical protein H0V70_08640 [Ktedonobacteraceae bacterium]|nr:hypothetical protein [Ktedonobacteraceae bacterium]
MLWMISAVTTPLALAVYLFIINWIDLFPWNNVRAVSVRRKLLLSLTNYPLLCFIAWAFLLGIHVLMVGAFVMMSIFYGIFYIVSWWIPYFYGLSERQQQEYERKSAGTVTILPRIGKRPVPNVERMIAGGLIVLMFVSAIQAMG